MVSVEFGPPADILRGLHDDSKAMSPDRGGTTWPNPRPLIRPDSPCVSPDRGLGTRQQLSQQILQEAAEQSAFDEYMVGRIRDRLNQEDRMVAADRAASLGGLPPPPHDIFNTAELARHVQGIVNPLITDPAYVPPLSPIPQALPLPGVPSHATAQYSSIPPHIADQLRRLEAERDEARRRAGVLQERVAASQGMLQQLALEAGLRRSNAEAAPAVVPEVGQLLARLDAINETSAAELSRSQGEAASMRQQLEALQQERDALARAQAERRREMEVAMPPPLHATQGAAASLPALRSQVSSLLAGRSMASPPPPPAAHPLHHVPGPAAGAATSPVHSGAVYPDPRRCSPPRQPAHWLGGAAPLPGGPMHP